MRATTGSWRTRARETGSLGRIGAAPSDVRQTTDVGSRTCPRALAPALPRRAARTVHDAVATLATFHGSRPAALPAGRLCLRPKGRSLGHDGTPKSWGTASVCLPLLPRGRTRAGSRWTDCFRCRSPRTCGGDAGGSGRDTATRAGACRAPSRPQSPRSLRARNARCGSRPRERHSCAILPRCSRRTWRTWSGVVP